jgi:archaellum component FlaC
VFTKLLMEAGNRVPHATGGTLKRRLQPEKGTAKVDEMTNDSLQKLVEGRENPGAEKEAVAELVSTLANDLAQCLVGAFENLQEHIVGESRKFNSAVQQQLERLQSTVDDVAQLRQPVQELVAAVAEQRKASADASERFGQIAATVSALKQSDARVTSEMEMLRGENRDLQMAVGAHSEELGTIKSTVTEASRRVTGMVEILERQGHVLRQLHAVESARASELERAFEDLARANTTNNNTISQQHVLSLPA